MADSLNASESLLHFNYNGVVIACRTAANCVRLDETLRSALASFT
jgi:hypothetical protein